MAGAYPGNLPYNETNDRTAASHEAWLLKALNAMRGLVWLQGQLTGGEGVIWLGSSTSSTTSLAVVALDPAQMKVKVRAGAAVIDGEIIVLREDYTTPLLVAPDADSRIDLVQINKATWAVAVKEGVADVSPVAPSADSGCVPLARLAIAAAQTTIATGNITDVREYVNR